VRWTVQLGEPWHDPPDARACDLIRIWGRAAAKSIHVRPTVFPRSSRRGPRLPGLAGRDSYEGVRPEGWLRTSRSGRGQSTGDTPLRTDRSHRASPPPTRVPSLRSGIQIALIVRPRPYCQVPLLFVNEFSACRSLYSALRLTLTSLSLAHLVVQLSQTRERVGREQYHSHEIGITLRSRTRRH
jgi:hypothetical protein